MILMSKPCLLNSEDFYIYLFNRSLDFSRVKIYFNDHLIYFCVLSRNIKYLVGNGEQCSDLNVQAVVTQLKSAFLSGKSLGNGRLQESVVSSIGELGKWVMSSLQTWLPLSKNQWVTEKRNSFISNDINFVHLMTVHQNDIFQPKRFTSITIKDIISIWIPPI